MARAWQSGACVAASATLYALCFPPLAWAPLAWVALVPLLVGLRDVGLRGRLALMLVFSVFAGWGVGIWMPGAVARYFDQPWWVGFCVFLAVAAVMAGPYYMLFGALYPRLRAGGCPVWARPVLVGAGWAAAELLRGRLLNGTLTYIGNSTWATLGYSQAGSDVVVQIASVAGVYGVSFTLACANATLAELYLAMRGRTFGRETYAMAGVSLALIGAILSYGWLALQRPRPGGRSVSVAIVQANLTPSFRWNEGGAARTLDAYLSLSKEATGADPPRLVFWPEGALTFFLEREPLYRRAIGAVLSDLDAELVTGAPRAEGEGAPLYRNSVYLMSANGELRERYDKQYLLPLMEFFPFGIDLLRRRFSGMRAFSPGAHTPPLPTRAGPAGILVCNEVLMPHVAGDRMDAGARYLVNPANDSWVPDSSFAEHQLQIATLRAVEQRATLVRVSDSGPSAIIDAYGRPIVRSAAQSRAVLIGKIAAAGPRSIYGRVGDLFGLACVLLVGISLAPSLHRRGRAP